jgi:hypothetical protein
MPWQQAVGSYGLDRAGEVFERPDIRSLALRGAKRAMDAWQQHNGVWLTYWNMRTDGTGTLGTAANHFGMPLAPAVVLKHEPTNAKAVAVWSYLLPHGGPWLAP